MKTPGTLDESISMSAVSKKKKEAPAVSAERIVPQRARNHLEGRKVKAPTWMRLMLGRDPEPSQAEWSEMTDALMQGDAPMDELIDWMFEFGAREGRAMFMQALEHGIETVPDAPEPLRNFFARLDATPDWVDWKLMREGVLFTHRIGLAGAYILRDLALMGGYLLAGFNRSLVLTGALNKGPAKRMAETGKWWMDCTELDGMTRFGPGFKSTVHVRLIHAMVRRQLQTREEWDNAQDGLPVNQIDMVATYLAFGPIMLLGVRAMGIPITPRESKAVMHLWKYMAWAIGVEDKWLVDDERAGLVQLYHTFVTQSPPDWTSAELGKALAQEPLSRTIHALKKFPLLHDLRVKAQYHMHLSTSSLFLNKKQRRQLGLPQEIYPWFPVLTAGPRFVWYTSHRIWPSSRRRLEKLGRSLQVQAMGSMFGEQEHSLIKPDEHHPAHA
jgi:hypothetical protein